MEGRMLADRRPAIKRLTMQIMSVFSTLCICVTYKVTYEENTASINTQHIFTAQY